MKTQAIIQINIQATAKELPDLLRMLKGEGVEPVASIQQSTEELTDHTEELTELATLLISNGFKDEVKEAFAAAGARKLSEVTSAKAPTAIAKLNEHIEAYGLK